MAVGAINCLQSRYGFSRGARRATAKANALRNAKTAANIGYLSVGDAERIAREAVAERSASLRDAAR